MIKRNLNNCIKPCQGVSGKNGPMSDCHVYFVALCEPRKGVAG